MNRPTLVDQEIAAPSVAAGAYLTDGTNLFRVSGMFGSDASPLVALEDCSTLELILYQPEELAEASLELVRGSADSAGSLAPQATGSSRELGR